jgi:site-specific DNA-methyltransferase (adenine-specific)
MTEDRAKPQRLPANILRGLRSYYELRRRIEGSEHCEEQSSLNWQDEISRKLLDGVGIKTYYQDEHSVIICSDCRSVLPYLPKVDLVLTDPPYGHGNKWSGGTWGAAEMYAIDARRWDAAPVDTELLAASVVKGAGAIVWGGNYFKLPPSRGWLAWEKSSKMATLADFELAWTSFDRPSKLYLEDRNPDGRRYHPTQKPINLFVWCIGFGVGNGLILDPFMGSGTTLVAAKQLGRRAIGIEIEEKYCAIAVERLRQEMLPLVEPAPQPEQLNLDESGRRTQESAQ